MEAQANESSASEADRTSITWNGNAFEPRVLLHFDIRASSETTRRRVDRFLYGSRETRVVHGAKRTYRYPGLLERTNGRHYGQSVVILSPDAAGEAFFFLRGMKVQCEKVGILAPDWV